MRVPRFALNSGTPGLPFLGNPLVVINYMLNATTASAATATCKVGVRRQPDCSLAEDLVRPGAASPDTANADFIDTLTGVRTRGLL
jgi:hypothetical protein